MINNDNIRHILARIALAVIFIGIGIWEVVQPQYWNAFVPQFLSNIINANTLVGIHGVVLLIVGLAVLSGTYLRIASILAVLIMLEIMATLIFESGFTDLVIRDAAVLVLALSLAFDDTNYLRFKK
jgi:uncharacterized membrane protein